MLDLTAVPQLARNLTRVVEIVRVLAKYGLADWLARLDYATVRRWTRGTELARLSAETHEARIRLVLTELGTTFIKFGQVLSTRRDLIGPALADELTRLQKHVPADPFPVTKQTVEDELKRPLAEVFPQFEEQPLASASIGQVHRATLRDGRKVVVKVQHPGIQRRVVNDLAILAELAALAEQYLPEVRHYRPVAVVAEFERTLRRELDFRRELRYLQMFRQAFADDPGVAFPEPFPAVSTGLVLTMEYFDGPQLTELERVRRLGGDPDDLARRGARIFLEMIFRNGLFHADPHPGNLLFLKRGDPELGGCIGLIDVGMVGRVDGKLREKIERAVTAVIRHDAATITDLIVQVADVPARFDAAAMEAEVAEQLSYYWGMPLEQFQLGTALNDLTDAVRRFQVMLPPTVALMLRVLVMLEGTGRLLSPKFNLVELLTPYKKTLVLKRLSPRRMWRRAMTALQEWDDLLRGLPRQLGAMMRMAQRQELGIQLIHKHLEPSVNRAVFGLMVSSLFLGSAIMWAAKAPPLLWDVPVFGVAGCVWACMLGYRLFRAIQHSGRLEDKE